MSCNYKTIMKYVVEKLFYEKKEFQIVEKIKTYCNRHKTRYEHIRTGVSTILCYPEYFEGGSQKLIEAKCPNVYIAELDNIYVYPETSILTDNRRIYCDEIVNDIDGRCDFRGGAIIDVAEDKYYCAYFKSIRKIKEGIYFNGIGSRNLFHLSLEILSKMWLIDQFAEYKQLPLIMDASVFRVPQLKELVELVNVNKHYVIQISARTKVRRLVYVSALSPLPFNVRDKKDIPEDNSITQEAIFNVRKCILERYDIRNIKAERKIFCSRRKTNNVRLINSEEVEKIFEKYGFEIVFTEDMSIIEQIKLFRGAKYVAGASGAAFTNIIYCHKEAVLIHIFPESVGGIDYPTIANLVGMKCIGLDGNIVGEADTVAEIQYVCDLNYCERFLKAL